MGASGGGVPFPHVMLASCCGTHACLSATMQVASVKEGELFHVETVEWTGGQIKDSDSSDDIKHVDLCQVRKLFACGATPVITPLSWPCANCVTFIFSTWVDQQALC